MWFFAAGVLVFLCASIAVHSDSFPFIDESGRMVKTYNDECGGRGITLTPRVKMQHRYTLIFLHGYNKVIKSKKLVNMLMKNDFIATGFKIIMPYAPVKDYNNGTKTLQWADLPSPLEVETALESQTPVHEDYKGYLESSRNIGDIIRCEERKFGIPSSKIVVGGFSQGGVTAYLTGLQFNKPLLGIFGISCWVPLTRKQEVWADYKEYRTISITDAAKNVPVLHLHGALDVKIPYRYFGAPSVAFMEYNGVDVTSDPTFQVGHDLIQEEADAVADYIQERINDINEMKVNMKVNKKQARQARKERRASKSPTKPYIQI